MWMHCIPTTETHLLDNLGYRYYAMSTYIHSIFTRVKEKKRVNISSIKLVWLYMYIYREIYFITLIAQDKNLKPQERFWEAFLITLPTLTYYFVGAQSNGLTYNF
jgi:hypothetical protein